MASTAGFGSQLAYTDTLGDTTNTATYTDVAQTRDLGFPGSEIGSVEVVHNDLAAATVEYEIGLTRPQEYEFELVYEKGQCAALYTLKNQRAKKGWRITVPDGSVMVFDGFITGLGAESETDDGLWTMTCTLQQSGVETFIEST